MLTKNKIRRLNPEEISELASTQTDPQSILICQQVLIDRNTTLQAKRQQLLVQLQDHRAAVKDAVIELKDSMKEKLRFKEKLVMDKSSRPTTSQMKQLSMTYAISEKQNGINEKKDHKIVALSAALSKNIVDFSKSIAETVDNSHLDRKYQELNAECKKQLEKRDVLIAERDQYRKLYETIEDDIENRRKAYEQVQISIKTAERQLINLSSYLENRSKQDKQTLGGLRKIAEQLQHELLKGQQLMNTHSQKKGRLRISWIEAVGPLPSQ